MEKHLGLQPALCFKWKHFTTSFLQGLCPWIDSHQGAFVGSGKCIDSEPKSHIPGLLLSLFAGVTLPFWASVEAD